MKNINGEKLGTIHDLVLTPDFDNVSYAVVSTGGIFGIGTRLHAIPWSSVQAGIDGDMAVPISREEFRQDRGFTGAHWPSEGNPRWLSRPGERTEEVRFDMMTKADRESIQNRRFSRIKGTTVKGPEDHTIGTIRDMVVAADTGAVAYTIVSFGGFLGLGPSYAAVPMNAVDFPPGQRVAQVRVNRQALEAYAFSPSAFPNLSDPVYARQLNRAYGIESYDTVFGYVPPEESATAPMAPDTTRRTPAIDARVHEMSTLRIDPRATYNAATVRTIQGVVTAVGKAARVGTGPDQLVLHVQTDAGESYFVHAGPFDYVSKQNFFVVSGDRVNVIGAPAQVGEHSVILAAQISKNGQVLQLRNREGRPLWEHTPGMTPSTSERYQRGSSGSQSRPSGRTGSMSYFF
jgi:sporulation protein YlmC with PRC-barrel domain